MVKRDLRVHSKPAVCDVYRFLASTKKKIGILGGSFNPPHLGHLHISLLALKRLQLDEIWWLVSLSNPLKRSVNSENYFKRLEKCSSVFLDKRIKIVDLEYSMTTFYTFDIITQILKRCRNSQFIWIMGADCFERMDLWFRWEDIFKKIPIAIFSRNLRNMKALASKAAIRYKMFKIPSNQRESGVFLAGKPAWIFLHEKCVDFSSTKIRGKREG
jgi:nicotinate-nucleotide adenylyltransferase|tara:strand:+ start:3220 stop:3864 length:645 start_codon:yes stop_codon:yes gene_type:complete